MPDGPEWNPADVDPMVEIEAMVREVDRLGFRAARPVLLIPAGVDGTNQRARRRRTVILRGVRVTLPAGAIPLVWHATGGKAWTPAGLLRWLLGQAEPARPAGPPPGFAALEASPPVDVRPSRFLPDEGPMYVIDPGPSGPTPPAFDLRDAPPFRWDLEADRPRGVIPPKDWQRGPLGGGGIA